MKKIILILITILTLSLLSSCGDSYETPEGMQFIGGGEDRGYFFFAPEEWTKGQELFGVHYVYASRVDTTSVSFAEIDPASFNKPDPAVSDKDFFLSNYFDALKSEFPDSTKFGDNNGEAILLGSGETKAESAVKYTYSYLVNDAYTDSDQRVAFMQILATHGGRFYIMTYAASLEEKSEDVTYYDYYLEKLQTIIDNMRFTEKSGAAAPSIEYTSDKDGDILASDEDLAGFTLYVPSDFKVDYSSAIVSATADDGSNITMTKATATGTTI